MLGKNRAFLFFFKKIKKMEWLAFEFYVMLSRYHNIDGRYRETKKFKELFKIAIYEILQNNEHAAPIIHQCLKDTFLEPFTRVGIYKQIQYILLPALWKDHRTIEPKKQRKLTFLAKELHGVGRVVEAHIVRTIVKPYIRDMNQKWSKMTAVEKFQTVQPLLMQQSRTKYSYLTQ